ncbi:ABC transporter ATP-binding protein [Neoaquamicrobium sediminum]|uniref:ABC transporter ATP-binding protein n=1 Tax=Neoaquamicrobium sediminum TaxID=1849104 RepID=A0ABV3X0B4_9HYPH
MTDNLLLSVRSLSRRFGRKGPVAVDDLSFDIDTGEILALIGPSGCGKTTTLRMIAGFETPDTGRVLLSGRDLTSTPAEQRGIGMVFQDYALFPHMTVGENIRFGARRNGRDVVARYLGMVGLDGFEQRYPDQLSGGQQQRVALARSFAAEPRLILLDEPFSNLDAALRSAARREIRRLLKSAGIAIVFVTHDQEEALSFADRIAIMRDGRILQSGMAQEVYDRPADAFVATFLGRTNLLEGTAEGGFARTSLGLLPLTRPTSGRVSISLRPERLGIRAVEADEQPNGRIVAVEFKGHDMTYWVDCDGVEVQVDAMQSVRLAEGTPVRVAVDGEAVPLDVVSL